MFGMRDSGAGLEHKVANLEPLSSVRKNFRVSWYRSPIEHRKLRELMRPNDLQGWFQAGGHMGIAVITGAAVIYFSLHGMWLAMFVGLLAHGTVCSFFKGIAAHELGHGTVFKTKWLNRSFLCLYSLIGWHNFHEYAMSHTYHHRYTLHLQGDREVVLPQFDKNTPLYILQLFTFNFSGGLFAAGCIPTIKGTIETALGRYGTSILSREWSETLYMAHPEERCHAVRWARMILLFHMSVIIATVITQIWALPLVLTFPQFTAGALKHFVGFPMHCGLRSNVSDFRKCVRTITLDPISEFLYWRMNWHLEHHMYAGVPCYNLKKLHQVLAHDMPKPRTLVGAWKEMRTVWERQKLDPNYEFDTPVPAAGVKEVRQERELDVSIGDLAPSSLRGP